MLKIIICEDNINDCEELNRHSVICFLTERK